MNPEQMIAYARWYRETWAATPLAMKPHSKVPIAKGWTKPVPQNALEATLARGEHNLGLLLGAEGGCLMDVDIDADDAPALPPARGREVDLDLD